MMINRSVIETIDPTVVGDMNKMPYVLHLKHVKVTADGQLQSPDIELPDGPQDVRLLLKRLAARVTVKWKYNVTVSGEHYTLKQLFLQDVPLYFNYIPKPDADGVYPDIVNQYTTLEVSGYDVSANQTDGTYSFWVPANVRKDNPAVTSDQLRIKANASVGSSYLTFVSVSDKDAKKKFNYRIYLGNDDPSNFSVKSNTDYAYNVNFAHTTIPASDRRVTYIDPIPASENNDNLVPTANCFMVAPGCAFCFEPFEFQQNGTPVPNTVLKNWCALSGIKSVRLLWQTKENGDLGESVMGIVNADNDHTNIVAVKNTDGSALSTPATDKGQCRIYCRVAPNTTGGSGVIAAYDGENGTGNILWSWHVWVTDYNPDITGSATVLEPANKRKFKLKNVSTVMMDRNLGAYDGAVTIPATTLERSRTSGFHYQKGRKDPFPSSYTNKADLPDVYTFVLSETSPPEHVMNRYKADGIHAIVPKSLGSGAVSLQTAYRNPVSIAGNNNSTWCSEAGNVGYWSTTKNVHDPCPAGWRVLERADLEVLQSCTPTVPGIENGGILLHYDDTQNGTYLRYTGYPPNIQQLNYVGKRGFLSAIGHENIVTVVNGKVTVASMRDYDAHTTRCVQERVD